MTAVQVRKCRNCRAELDDVEWTVDPCPATDEGTHCADGIVRRALKWAATAGRTLRYLWTVRAAIPWPVKVILGVAMLVKCLPFDCGTDELLTLIAAVILNKTRPGLLKACWRAAQIRA